MSKSLLPEFTSGLRILTESHQHLQNVETVESGMELLFNGLRIKRQEWSQETWQQFRNEICLSHPIRKILHQDPITYRSFSKPRGYAGDAGLLDYLYRHTSADERLKGASPVGRAISEYMLSCPSAESVRWRRKLLANLIDETSARVPAAEILSVASGHLREARDSRAVQNNLIKRLVAFDQDGECLNAIKAEQDSTAIQCIRGSVKELILGKLELGEFDFIYSAGLYDYLNDTAARLLSEVLFKMLKRDGRLLIANFLPNNKECGYMEAFMDWELLYRTKAQLEHVTEPLSDYLSKLYFDDHRYVIYIEFRKY